jgi:hypothetical protein
MSDILATVIRNDNPTVTVVGIQGPAGRTTTIGNISDVDATNTVNGSVLVFKTNTNKWTSTLNLDQQVMDGGQF